MEMCKIVHNDYAKISDTIMWLNNQYLLKFNVELYTTRQTKNGNKQRENFHKEIAFNNSDGKFSVNIQRSYRYYLSIEEAKRSGDMKFSLQIGMQDAYFLLTKLESIINNLFMGENVNKIFSKINGQIKIMSKLSTRLSLTYGNYIEFEPGVSLNSDGNQIIGVILYINSDTLSTFVDINTLFSLKYFLSTFNMYQAAQNMLSYVGRPDNGTNLVNMSNNGESVPRGFFDRVNRAKG